MHRQIIWTTRACSELEHVIDFLIENWTESVASEFLDNLEKHIELINEYPEAYPLVNISRNIHKCVITKHNSLFYQISHNSIHVLSLFDTRQDSDKIML